ncbi:MAG: hypothetical protein ACRD2N_19530 [Vicinamibacterales bacterium]
MTLTPRERRLIARLSTPARVQHWLNQLPYNTEDGGETLRSFRPVARLETAHCLEAALFAAIVMEQHGYPPLVMSLESQDNLDHVIFIYQHHGRWGSVARSRDPGLHGRKAVFASPRALARSYIEPYVDYTGRVRAFGVANLADAMGAYDWRWAQTNVWKVEHVLIDWPHRRLKSSTDRYRRLKRWYREYRAAHNDRKPVDYRGKEKWTPIPDAFEQPGGLIQIESA